MNSNRSNRYNLPYDKRKNRKQKNYQKRKPSSSGFYLPRGTVIYILDIMEHGHIGNGGGAPSIIQAIEVPNFNLFEMTYNKSEEIKVQERIIIGNDERSKVRKVKKRLEYKQLTTTSKGLLKSTIELHLERSEGIYLKFLNNSVSITKRRHQLNLLPGVGEKVMWEIINARSRKPFVSFSDFNERMTKKVKDIKKLLSKRILNEIIGDSIKHYLFVDARRRSSKRPSQYRSRSRPRY
ncbi:MAG: DUF655 domain-containing protein [Promethearchaeota archaeon]